MNPAVIDVDTEGMRSTDVLAMWQACLDERMSLPPNERHAELSAIIDVLAARLPVLLIAEHDAAVALLEAERKQTEDRAAALRAAGRPDVQRLLRDLRLAVFAVMRATGEDACRTACERAMDDCAYDDTQQ